MNGKRYLLDTNAIVQLLAGNKELAGIVRGADFLATSVVCQFEFLSYPGLTAPDARLYAEFASRIHTFSVPADDASFSDAVVAFRRTKKLKMPGSLRPDIMPSTTCVPGLTVHIVVGSISAA